MHDQDMIRAAKAAMEVGSHIGHVFVQYAGHNMHIKCTVCGVTEFVKDYSDGKHPQKFVYQPVRMDGREYVKCESCGRVHDRAIPFAR